MPKFLTEVIVTERYGIFIDAESSLVIRKFKDPEYGKFLKKDHLDALNNPEEYEEPRSRTVEIGKMKQLTDGFVKRESDYE